MKLLMPITSAPIGRNRHMSISHRRDKPFIMAVIARYTSVAPCLISRGQLQHTLGTIWSVATLLFD